MSPWPGRSILITSAPSQASSWVQVGPDWTWVKSRTLTPLSALPSPPHGFFDTFGRKPLLILSPLTFLATTLSAGFLAGFFACWALALGLAFFAIFFAIVVPYFFFSLLCGLR